MHILVKILYFYCSPSMTRQSYFSCVIHKTYSPPNQQVAVVCIYPSVKKRERLLAVDENHKQSSILFLPHSYYITLFHHRQFVSSVQMATLLWIYSHTGLFRWDEDDKWKESSVCALLTKFIACFVTSLSLPMQSFGMQNNRSEWPLSTVGSEFASSAISHVE